MLDVILNNFVAFMFILLRVLALFFSAPMLSDNALPQTVRILISIFIAYLIIISLNIQVPTTDLSMWFLTFNAIKELLIGFSIGFFMQMIFWAVSYGGSLMGFDLGLAMAQVFNPNQEFSTDVVSQLLYILSIFIFIMINGHLFLFTALRESFNFIPLGGFQLDENSANMLIRHAGNVFIFAVKIASPIMVTFFLMNIAEAIMSRIIPQMQVFFVLYPLRIGIGFFLISSSMVFFFYIIKELLKLHEQNLLSLIKALG